MRFSVGYGVKTNIHYYNDISHQMIKGVIKNIEYKQNVGYIIEICTADGLKYIHEHWLELDYLCGGLKVGNYVKGASDHSNVVYGTIVDINYIDDTGWNMVEIKDCVGNTYIYYENEVVNVDNSTYVSETWNRDLPELKYITQKECEQNKKILDLIEERDKWKGKCTMLLELDGYKDRRIQQLKNELYPLKCEK